MASFIEDLWNSIFTPGPTPTLLLATNATFASLQVLLLALLALTYNLHFVVLSVLTGGLWWAINWFAREISKVQGMEEEAKRIRAAREKEKEKEKGSGTGQKGEKGEGQQGGEGEGMDSGDDTEVEGESAVGASGVLEEDDRSTPAPAPAPIPAAGLQTQAAAAAAATTSAQTTLKPQADETVRKRSSASEAGDLSTDSEWEKVDEGR